MQVDDVLGTELTNNFTDDAEMEMGDAENWQVDCRLDINDRAVFDSTPPRPAKLMPVRKTPTIAPTGSCVLLVADEGDH